jgi:hypothetical protein
LSVAELPTRLTVSSHRLPDFINVMNLFALYAPGLCVVCGCNPLPQRPYWTTLLLNVPT